jgi:hypothetical protein
MYRITRYYHGEHNGFYLDDVFPNGMLFATQYAAECVCSDLNDERVSNLRYEVSLDKVYNK